MKFNRSIAVKNSLVFALFLFCSFLTKAQTITVDSLKIANQEFDDLIQVYLNNYEEQGHEFMILRVRDSIYPALNQCIVISRKESCTTRFNLQMNSDCSIKYVHVNNIKYHDPSEPCEDELIEIADQMSAFDDFFKSRQPEELDLERASFVFYAKVFGNYALEYFEFEFVSEFHSGLLYDVVCFQLYANCKH